MDGHATTTKIAFAASDAQMAQAAMADLVGPLRGMGSGRGRCHGRAWRRRVHASDPARDTGLDLPVYGMNRGTVGFLMNEYAMADLPERLALAEEAILNPLRMRRHHRRREIHVALAINEVSLLRAGPQAAKLRISVDGRVRLEELVCDGALVSTPAGSTAYNYSAHGPILPIGSGVLALTAIAAFRPRRWRGALLPKAARVQIDVIDAARRPAMADADSRSVNNVARVEIASDPTVAHRILFDPGHGLEERLISEQFA